MNKQNNIDQVVLQIQRKFDALRELGIDIGELARLRLANQMHSELVHAFTSCDMLSITVRQCQDIDHLRHKIRELGSANVDEA
jgi:hypothetical protein